MTEKYIQKEYDYVDLSFNLKLDRCEVEERIGHQITDEQWDKIVPSLEDLEVRLMDGIIEDLYYVLDEVLIDEEIEDED